MKVKGQRDEGLGQTWTGHKHHEAGEMHDG